MEEEIYLKLCQKLKFHYINKCHMHIAVFPPENESHTIVLEIKIRIIQSQSEDMTLKDF